MKAHFSQWGTVTDVYFPKNKHTFRRRPFCFVTFVTLEAAQRALAESPMNICGEEPRQLVPGSRMGCSLGSGHQLGWHTRASWRLLGAAARRDSCGGLTCDLTCDLTPCPHPPSTGIPIKQLTMVEDRMDYYKNRNMAAQNALVQALQTLALVNNSNNSAGSLQPAAAQAPQSSAGQPALDLNNLAALLALESTTAGMRTAPPQPQVGRAAVRLGSLPLAAWSVVLHDQAMAPALLPMR